MLWHVVLVRWYNWLIIDIIYLTSFCLRYSVAITTHKGWLPVHTVKQAAEEQNLLCWRDMLKSFKPPHSWSYSLLHVLINRYCSSLPQTSSVYNCAVFWTLSYSRYIDTAWVCWTLFLNDLFKLLKSVLYIVCIRLVWLRIGTGGELLWAR
jgi:hypothetical protein